MLRPALVFSFLIATFCIFGTVYATSGDLTLSLPTTVDMSGHQKSEIIAGEPVGFSSIITNHGTTEKRFTYVVLVLNQAKQIEFQEGLSASIGSSQSFTVAQSWTPKESGTYTVQTVLLNGYLLSSRITDVIETKITVK